MEQKELKLYNVWIGDKQDNSDVCYLENIKATSRKEAEKIAFEKWMANARKWYFAEAETGRKIK